MTGSIKTLRSTKDVVAELRFVAKHIDRKSNEIIFMKCRDPLCGHCVRAPIKCVKAWEYLKQRDFIWFNPLPSQTHPNHYMTFVEMNELDNTALPKGMIFCV